MNLCLLNLILTAVGIGSGVQLDNSGAAVQPPALFDIRTYGASTSRADNDVPINAAIAAAAAKSPPPVVLVPTGTWPISKPIVLTGANGLVLHGEGMFQSIIQAGNFDGPDVLMSGDTTPFPDAGSLATGAGIAMDLHRSDSSILNFSRSSYFWTAPLNGLSAFNLQFFVKLKAVASDTSLIYYGDSAGDQGLASDHGNHKTFQWLVYNNLAGAGAVHLTVGGTDKILSATIPLNTIVECELDYDGAHVRTFVNGVLQESQAATGTITSTTLQDFLLGPIPRNFPVNAVQTSAPDATIDSIRLSKISRHTANYTPPTAKFTQDSNTVFLENFDQVTTGAGPILVGATVNGGQEWYVWQSRNNAGSSSGLQVSDLQFTNGGHGVVSLGSLGAVYKNLYCHATYGCLYADDFGFGSIFDNILAQGGGTASSMFGVFLGNVGLSPAKNLNLLGWQLPLIANSDYLENVFISPSTYTIWGAVIYGDAALNTSNNWNVLKDFAFDFENINPAALGAVYMQNVQKALILGGSFDMSGTGNGLPTFTLNNVGQLESIGGEFAGGSTPAPVFAFAGATPTGPGTSGGNNPVTVKGGYRFKTKPPWADAGMEDWVHVEEPGFSGNGYAAGVVFVDAGYNASFLDDYIAVSLPLGAAVKIVLPPCTTQGRGKRLPVKDESGLAGTYNVTVVVDGGGTIEGASSQIVSTNYSGIVPFCDGTKWYLEPPASISIGGTLGAVVFSGGATASGSSAFDLSGSSGTFKTTTGAATFGGSSNTFTNGMATGNTNVATLTGAASGSNPAITMTGGDSAVGLNLVLKGAGGITITSPGSGNVSFGNMTATNLGNLTHQASTADYVDKVDAVSANQITVGANNATSVAIGKSGGAISLVGSTTASSTKNSGTITLSSGTGTATVTSGTHCVCTDTSGLVSTGLQCTVSSTTLTATEVSGSDVIAYICF